MWKYKIKRTGAEREKFDEVFKVARERAAEVAKAKETKVEVKVEKVPVQRQPTYLEKLTGQMFRSWEGTVHVWAK